MALRIVVVTVAHPLTVFIQSAATLARRPFSRLVPLEGVDADVAGYSASG
jgi:hypothetical protein